MTIQPIVKPDTSKPVSKNDWLLVEEYYLSIINRVNIPQDPTPYNITDINSRLDRLYHEARLDYYYTSRAFESIASAYKKIKRALYPLVKGGKNVEEREYMLQDYLTQTTLDKLEPAMLKSFGLPSAPVNVYTVYESYKERMDFMKALLDIISDKTGRLITDSGAMKIESRLAPSG